MSKAIKEPREARAIDHAVLPVESLEATRARLSSALGFTVAPDGMHPFGTENACVYFADGTFLEPLGGRAARGLRGDSAQGQCFHRIATRPFRFRCGENGFSALAFAYG
jgi:hypothetical protein